VPGSAGPIGDVSAISGEDRRIIETATAHGLEDKTLVRIRQGALRTECYVKPAAPNQLEAYLDAELKQTIHVNEGFTPGATIESLNADDWAVVVGIKYYPGLRDLKGPVDDATEFKNWALNSGYVPDRQLIFLQSPAQRPATTAEAQPTGAAITQAFETLIRAARPKKFHYLGRRLYLFFSGHGIVAMRATTPDYSEAALLTADADQLFMKHVSLRSWAEWFRAYGIFDEVLLFADCCREQEDFVPPAAPSPPPWPRQREAGCQFYVFSTTLAAKAWEQELGKPPRYRGVLSFVGGSEERQAVR